MRRSRAGPEQDLLDMFVTSGGVPRLAAETIRLVEPALPTGYPDLVCVSLDPASTRTAIRELTVPQLRLLHYLYSSRTSLVSSIASSLRNTESMLRRRLDQLCALDVLRLDKGRVWLPPRREIFPARSIVAVEAKISEPTRALHQASANRWFASRSYILVPRLAPAKQVQAAARRLGVGIIVQHNDGPRTVLPARRQRIPISYGSWLVALLAARLNQRATPCLI